MLETPGLGGSGAASFRSPQPPVEGNDKPLQNYVTCVHRAQIADLCRNVSVTWSKNHINHTLLILVESPSSYRDNDDFSCKIDLKTWQFWGKKGLKSFKVDEKRVDVFWDLRYAKFASSPEPCSDYYVAVVSGGEVGLLLGDQKEEAYKRTRSKPSVVEANLLQKKENVFAKNCFCARSWVGKGKREHDIVIESCFSGVYDPEIWIGIDGIELIRIMNLDWRFRGNDVILVDDVPVQIFWDVHDWLYGSISSNNDNSGPGLFIFVQGAILECEASDQRESSWWQPLLTTDFCHFLYAWKTEVVR